MGLFAGMRRRRIAREDRIRAAAYDKAVAKGKTPEQAAKAAERAVRRRRMVIIGAANSGGS